MFTGIIEEIGKIKSIKKGTKSCSLGVEGEKIFSDLKLGDSVSTNGVCLTVASIEGKMFISDVMNETLSRSSLGLLKIGSRVNLERAMPLNGRFGGHIVSGHIDGTGSVYKITKDDIAFLYTIKTQKEIMRYIVEKGSVAIDGISLTVAGVSHDSFVVSVIPHTIKETVLSDKTIGSIVNLENDIIAKYIEKFMPNKGVIDKDFLLKNGY